jgi:Mg-chelatase subunit ChlD
MTRTLVGLLSLIAVVLFSPAEPAGARQSIVSMRIAILVDTSLGTSTSLHLIKSAVASFIEALPEGPEVMLVSTGRRAQVRVQPTTDRKKVAQSVNGISSDGGPTPLMEAVLEVDERFMRKGVRPMYVLVTSDGSESSAQGTGEKFNAWLPTLGPRHAVAHAVVLKSGNGFPEQIARALVQATGGVFETIGNAGLLADRLKVIAERIRAVHSETVAP